MTDHDPLPVAGYTKQTDANVGLVNENKHIEERLLRRIDALASTGGAVDGRWLAIAKTHFEEGFMALNRAVFKPKRIDLPGDDAAA